MIAGFNTDIEYDGTVYHVQTEDKGAPHCMIMSLVYNKGTILASKRTTYDENGSGEDAEKELAERVSRQHKLMCAAVKAGRISELVDMTRKTAAVAGKNGAQKPVPEIVTSAPAPVEPAILVPSIPVIPVGDMPRAPISIALVDEPPPAAVELETAAPVQLDDKVFDGLPVVDAVEIIEEVEVIPEVPVAVVSELSGKPRTAHSKLGIELLGEAKFRGGERRTINLMLCRGTERKIVPGAQIIVKVWGSAFRPVIFHSKTDDNGLAKVHLQLPQFSAGRAALLIRALSDGEEVELRKLVSPS